VADARGASLREKRDDCWDSMRDTEIEIPRWMIAPLRFWYVL
jgi:hypothetical protein